MKITLLAYLVYSGFLFLLCVVLFCFFLFVHVLEASNIRWLTWPLVHSTCLSSSSKLVHHWNSRTAQGGALDPIVVQDQFCLHRWSKPIMWYESPDVVCSQSTWVSNTELSLQHSDTEVREMLRSWFRQKVTRSLGCHLERISTGPVESNSHK